MRTMEFKMERPGKLSEGQTVYIWEGELPSNYYYTAGIKEDMSLAMSPNIPFRKRLKSKEGTVTAINENPKGFYITVTFDEDEPE
ncbi:MAG: hypothetical protein II760_05915 [Lachnospiraceae bacterium]|nr:hypothetical protein [Lachnospiraceae bacterium]